jgi:hypothetical protein
LANEGKMKSSRENSSDAENLRQRLDIMDERMDNIDSVLSAVAERIMKQPISMHLKCPHCGKDIEIALVGQNKPT